MNIKLSADEMRYIALFEGLTGARVQDCVIDEGGKKLTFVVRKGDIGLAVGKGGNKIRRVKRVVGKSIDVVEHSTDPIEFVRNVFMPARVKGVNIVERDGKKIAMVNVEERERGVAVGRRGKKVEIAKKLVFRHHGIQDISLT